MFSKMRRTKENSKQETNEVTDDMVKKVEDLEELVSKRTTGLEETREQLEKLSDNSEGSEGEENKAEEAADALLLKKSKMMMTLLKICLVMKRKK